MAADHDELEALERAVEEIGALEAIFGYEDGAFTVHSEGALAAARSAIEDPAELPDGWSAPQLDIELRLMLELVDSDAEDGRPVARLRCTMAPGYPAVCCASVSVSIEGLRRGAADRLTERLTEKAASLVGEEAVMELVQELQDIAPETIREQRDALVAEAAAPKSGSPASAPQFGRRWIWAQTVTKPPNRALAVNWANDLQLGGFLKPGSPGIFVFEGESAACDEFIKQLKAVPNSCLRSVSTNRASTLWSNHNRLAGNAELTTQLVSRARGRALSIRGVVNVPLAGFDSEAVDNHRRLPNKFVDLDVTDMGGLGALTYDSTHQNVLATQSLHIIVAQHLIILVSNANFQLLRRCAVQSGWAWRRVSDVRHAAPRVGGRRPIRVVSTSLYNYVATTEA